MDITTLFQSPIVETIGGETIVHAELKDGVETIVKTERVGGTQVSFARVPSRAVGIIMASYKAKLRERARDDANTAKLDAAQTFRALQVAGDELRTSQIIDYIDTPEGAEAVIRESLKRSKCSPEEIEAVAEAMDFAMQTNLALRLTGVYTNQTKKMKVVKSVAADGGPPAFGAPAQNATVPPLEPKGFASPNSSTGSEPPPNLNTTSESTPAN